MKDIVRTLIKDTVNKIGEEVVICGFVKIRRDHGKLIFLDVEDRTARAQVVVIPQSSQAAHLVASQLHPEDSVMITAKVSKRPEKNINPELSTGTVELDAKKITILAKADTLPFDMGGRTLHLELPTLLDHRSLTLRHPQIRAIFKTQAAILEGFRKIVKALGCTEIVVPTISASATEGGAEVFRVDYFGYKAYMTQSPQLYKQMLIPVFERVFTIAHAYRAEPSVTTRHLTEATMLDCEFGFVTFEELIDLLEEVGTKTLLYAEEMCQDIFREYKFEKIAVGTIPRLTLRRAQEIIHMEFGRDVRGEKDMSPQDEVDICIWAKKHHQSDFVTITHFPTKKRAFYTMPDPGDPEYSLSYDLLFRGVEILSGSQRINEYASLVAAIKDRGMDPKDFEMYLQAFRFGCPPEGGFSFGLERLTMKMLELSNVREASLYPRDMERVDERLSVIKEHHRKQK